jgi:reductive dehalogenase
MGPQRCDRPEELGMPRWSGTEEEAARLLRRASLFVGAGLVGFAHLGQHERDHLVFTHNKGGGTSAKYINNWPPPTSASGAIVFEDVDVGYEEPGVKYVLPKNKELWDISVMTPMAKNAWRTARPKMRAYVRDASNTSRYRLMATIQPCIQEFIRGLGYNCYGYPDGSGGLIPAQASAVFSGISEPSRFFNGIINPEYGSITGYYSLITDLPLAHDHPVDAGIFRFCHTCRRCADNCPADGPEHINTDPEPSWEIPAYYGKPQISSSPGKKLFWSMGCNHIRSMNGTSCGTCHAVCTFNVGTEAAAHAFAKGLVATTGIFNGFLWQMSDVFGYGLKNASEWWDMELPSLGYDTSVPARDGGY